MIQLSPGTVLYIFTAKDGREVILRTPKWDDIDDALDFINSLVAEDAMILANKPKTREDEINWISNSMKKLEKSEFIMIFAEVDGHMFGAVEVNPLTGKMSHVGVLGISVKKEYRDIGIGLDLLKEAEKHAIHMRLKTMQLEVFEKNERAIHVYEKMGYEVTGKIPKGVLHAGEYQDVLLMTRKLPSS